MVNVHDDKVPTSPGPPSHIANVQLPVPVARREAVAEDDDGLPLVAVRLRCRSEHALRRHDLAEEQQCDDQSVHRTSRIHLLKV